MKYIYNFQQGNAAGNKDLRDLLGGKGANLAEMCNLNLPVPPGFTIIPEASKFFIDDSFNSDEKFKFNTQFSEALKRIELLTKSFLGSEKDPCLLSVRSGAKYSMPGMMDTVLNLGLNSYILDNLIESTGNPYYVYDCYRRFIQTYGTVVLDIDSELFEEKLECLETPTIDELKKLCVEFKDIIADQGKKIPSSVYDQLRETIKSVYKSWNSDRAKTYRHMNDIPENIGTAVSVQAMVYGNKNEISFTGVLFSRDCMSGENLITGEFLRKAQGEDIVSGMVTPDPVSLYSSNTIAKKLGYTEEDRLNYLNSLEEQAPSLFRNLEEIAKKLEKHFKEVQDIEFTVEDSVLWILQTRKAKRTKRANALIQKSLFLEGVISEDELFERTDRYKLGEVQKFKFKDALDKKASLLGIGLAASSGLAVGRIVLSNEKAIKEKNSDIILVRDQTDTHDLEAILSAKGTLTAKGGTTSHAAVVCRGYSLCCIVGSKIHIDLVTKRVQIGDDILNEGDWISLDGDTGEIFKGKLGFDT